MPEHSADPSRPAAPASDGGDATTEFVAVDLETTGLSASRDRIIEIGATRFSRSGAATAFSTFVDPGIPIPPEIRDLTGITDADVAGAPPIAEAGARLAAFASDAPVVGHNVRFDLGFLRAAGVHLGEPSYDTWELASVLLPSASRLSLGALAEMLEIAAPVAHRALADAETTRDAFLRLLALLDALPRAVLEDLRGIAGRAQWPLGTLVARALLGLAPDAAPDAPPPDATAPAVPAAPAAPAARASLRRAPAPDEPSEPPRPTSEADIETLFDAAAHRPDLIPGFEVRRGQIAMAQAVARIAATGGHLAVEAGTGTGKSLAYLLPSLLHALRNDGSLVISTHTRNLQEQLAANDIPAAAALVEAHEDSPPGALRAVMLKGRANYLCLERWDEARRGMHALSLPEARLLARLAVWLPGTESGDMASLYLPAEERPLWNALSAEATDCQARRCAYVRDGTCLLLRARQRAAEAHVVVVNHALLLANAASDDQVLPPFRHLVIDEAHRLEEVATRQYGAALSMRELTALLEEIAGAGGVSARLRGAATPGASALSPAAGLSGSGGDVAEAARRAHERVPDLARLLTAYAEEHDVREGDLALTSARHSQPLWAEVEEAAVQVDVALLHLVDRLQRARSAAGAIPQDAAPGLDRMDSDLQRAAESVGRARETVRDVALDGDPDLVTWLHVRGDDASLHVAPLEVAERLATEIYEGRHSVTVTSATLTTAGSFDFSVRRLGLLDPETLLVPSPFDYRRAALVIVAEDIPPPDKQGYAEAVHNVLGAAAQAAGGRTLALFTSHAAIRGAAAALRERLAASGLSVLAQEIDGPPARLLRALGEQPRTVLLGTSAFWEGVDVRGEALSLLAVARLPFPVPSDPVFQGRSAAYENPFNDYAVPQAALRFRQGFGRLIRGSEERGVFLILDSRVVGRRYGDAFLDSLPDCEVRRLPSAEVGDAVARWLQR